MIINIGNKLRDLEAPSVRDKSQFDRNFRDIDRKVLWNILENVNVKDEAVFPTAYALIEFIYDATVMHYKLRHESEKGYIDELEATVIAKRGIIERQERELVKLQNFKMEVEDGIRERGETEGPKLRKDDSK